MRALCNPVACFVCVWGGQAGRAESLLIAPPRPACLCPTPHSHAHPLPACCRETPLLLAARRGHSGSVEVLLQRGARADAPNAAGVTPLMAAAFFDHAPAVRALLDRCGGLAWDGWVGGWGWGGWGGGTSTAPPLEHPPQSTPLAIT